jgi:uncharacterized protein (TIGR02444 family)
MAFWDWAVAAYARPGVSDLCLTLQDDHGQSVPFLLWAAWAGAVPHARLAAGAALAQDWERRVVGPMRQVRRALKPAHPRIVDAAREGLREDVKACELRAERALMEVLAEGGPGSEADAVERLTAACRAWGGPPPPPELLTALADALKWDRRG